MLNNTPDARVSSSTRARVLAAALNLGYSPNALARSLRTGTHGTIGLIGEGIATAPLLSGIVFGAHEAVKLRGDVLLVMGLAVEPGGEDRRRIMSLLQGSVDGLLFVASSPRLVTLPHELDGYPVVVVNGRSHHEAVSWVAPADDAAGWDAAEALITAGHTRVALINSEEATLSSTERERGFRRRAEAEGLRGSEVSVVQASESAAGAYRAARWLLDGPNAPSGISCFNDRMAMGVYRAAAELNLAVPQALSIIGFEDEEDIARSLYPALTTLALPSREMATWAVEHLYARILDPSADAVGTTVPCRLVVRDSIAPPP